MQDDACPSTFETRPSLRGKPHVPSTNADRVSADVSSEARQSLHLRFRLGGMQFESTVVGPTIRQSRGRGRMGARRGISVAAADGSKERGRSSNHRPLYFPGARRWTRVPGMARGAHEMEPGRGIHHLQDPVGARGDHSRWRRDRSRRRRIEPRGGRRHWPRMGGAPLLGFAAGSGVPVGCPMGGLRGRGVMSSRAIARPE